MNIVMELYHGTTKDSAEKILKKVDVKLGGGELGRGFYLGGTSYLAYSWARQKAQALSEEATIIIFDVPEDVIDVLCTKSYSLTESRRICAYIKKKNRQRDYLIGSDLVWAYIAGSSKISEAQQFKFESSKAETYLNTHKLSKKKHGLR